MNDIYRCTAHELQVLLQRREITSEEIVDSLLSRIANVDKEINAYISVMNEAALKRAREIDKRRTNGEKLGPLAGIPIAVKDNMCTNGVTTTAGSKMLSNFIPPYNAYVVERIIDAGMIIIGKTNMDEFAMGSSTETSYFGPTKNPWDLSKVPGGTSGGSAAAVASDEAIIALGSDTGGSIRQPASFCGVVGLKPTYGRVSRYGLISYVSSFDQIGILSKDVMDCAVMLRVIAGYDERDSTSVPMPVADYIKSLQDEVRGLKVGVPVEYLGQGIEPEVRVAVEQAARMLMDGGVICEEVSLPTTEYVIPTYYIIATSEASANLARYDGVKYGFRSIAKDSMWEILETTRGEGFGSEVRRRIILGAFALSAGYYDAYYLKAQKVRTLIRNDYEKVFSKCDALLMPVSPIPPFNLGEKLDDPLKMYLADVCTVTANLAGVPGINVPFRLDSNGLPIGLQLQGPPFSEEVLFRLATAIERQSGFKRQLFS